MIGSSETVEAVNQLRLIPELIDERALKVMDRLEAAGYEGWLVGGSVRDNLLRRPLHDFDLTTNALPQEIIELFGNARCIPTGLKHGTVTVLSDGLPVEVTTFRQDRDYTDHRRPQTVLFSANIQDDLARRDFTINAIAWSARRGLFDPFGGRTDLQRGVIRAVGEPDRRFHEDALRILRALRLSSELDFDIDPLTRQAMLSRSHLLGFISVERITQEVSRIILADPGRVWCRDQSIWGVIFPLLSETDWSQRCELSWESYCALPQTEAVRFPAFFLKLAATVAYRSDLPEESPDELQLLMVTDNDTISEFLRSLRLSNEQNTHVLQTAGAVRELLNMIFDRRHAGHLRIRKPVILRRPEATLSGASPLLSRQDADYEARLARYGLRRVLREFGEPAARAACDILRILMQENYADEWARLHAACSRVAQASVPHKITDLSVNGEDIIRYGVRQGAEIGEILRKLLEEVMAENIPNERESLLQAVRELLRYGAV